MRYDDARDALQRADGRLAREAQRTSHFLDDLLAAGARHAPAVPADATLEPGIRLAAARLRADLVRVHPSFRFQEDLAARLSFAAARLRDGQPLEVAVAPDPVGLAVFPFAPLDTDPMTEGEEPAERLAARPHAPVLSNRPLLVGGVASAALSIGAVYVAWRFSHPSEPAMARAARAAHTAARLAAAPPRSRRRSVLPAIFGGAA